MQLTAVTPHTSISTWGGGKQQIFGILTNKNLKYKPA
jgi:hypothetical protein